MVVTSSEASIGLDSCGRRLGSSRTLEKSVGGTESTTPIRAARLGHRTAFIGRVAADPLGREVGIGSLLNRTYAVGGSVAVEAFATRLARYAVRPLHDADPVPDRRAP